MAGSELALIYRNITRPLSAILNYNPASSAGTLYELTGVAGLASMTEITRFVALAFDLTDGSLMAGEPVDCATPVAAIQTARGQWQFFGHVGAVAFSRTSDFEKGKFNQKHVLRRFGQVPDEFLSSDE
jgi:hypothetical protein